MRQRATRLSAIGGVSRRALAPAFILDQLGVQSAAAYSLRRLRAAHMGSADRVRRSSDNAEANIGFATSVQTRTNLAAVPINNDGGAGGSGVTMTTVGTGTEFGQPYVEVRWQGTATAIVELRTAHGPQGAFNPTTMAPVTPGLAHAVSLGFRLVAGTFPPGTPAILAVNFNAAGGVTSVGETGVPAATAVLQRGAVNFTPPAGSAYVQPRWRMGAVPSGTVVDFTMRFYAANVEQGIGNARPLLQRNVPEVIADIGDYDAEAVLAHVGNGDGFVTIWYDQSGNGRDAPKTTLGAQPRIVNAGVLEISNGKPAIRFNGSSMYLGGVSLTLSQFTLASVLNDVAQSGTIRYPIGTGSTLAGRGIFSSFQLNPNKTLGFTTDAQPGVVQTGFLPTIGQSYVVSLTTTATESNIRVNGGNSATGGIITLNQLFIGQRGDNNWYYDGYESETIVFPSALSTTDRQLLERNQGQYYGITVA